MRVVLIGATLAAFSRGASAKPFELTRGGAPRATIVVSARPSRAAAFGARELRDHVEKITGVRLPQVTDAGPVSGPRILVGESAATRQLGLRSTDFASQEYLVGIRSAALVLMGRDQPTAAPGPPGKNDPLRVPGKFGNALRFDGRGNVLVVPDCGFSDEAGTMEAWVWLPAENQKKHGTILRLDGAKPWTYHIVQRLPNSRQIGYSVYDGAAGSTIRSEELAEGWHHVMATHSRADERIELFIDGVSQGTARFTRSNCGGAALGIGALPSTPPVNNPFRGIVDEVRISAVVRPPSSTGGPYATDSRTTLLLHFDEADGPPRDESGRPAMVEPPGWYEERGSLDAVYDFLERHCGVRWYAPTAVGTCFNPARDLSVKLSELRRKPAMEYRWIVPRRLLMPTKKDPIPAVEETLWKLRMRLGGREFSANHSFYGYYDRFQEEHPDWFARGYDGKPPQMCYTHPGFIAQVVQDARDYFDGKGLRPGAKAMGGFFALVPMDNGKWCKCDRCQAELDPAEADNQQFTNGKASNYIWGFVNTVAKELGKTHPDKYVAGLAYADYAQYPSKVDLEPNIACMMCLTARHWWAPGMEAADRKMFHAWVERGGGERPLYLWLYYCFPALNAKLGKYNAFPGFFARTVVKQMKMWTDAGIRGFFLEHSSEMGESYLMDQLEFYLTFKLADDPSLDGEALIEEFFGRYYGPAGDAMKQLYSRIEETWSNPENYAEEIRALPGKTQHQNEEMAWRWLGTDPRMREFEDSMAEAKKAGGTDLERRRVAQFEQGIWRYMLQGKRKYVARARIRNRPPPKVDVPRCLDTPRGDPAAVDWDKAVVLGNWSTVAGDNTTRKIETRLAHDGAWLYVRLREAVHTAKLVVDEGVWRGDDWELFFASRRKRPYRQLGVAPSGTFLALAPDEPGDRWDSGVVLESDTSDPDTWTVRLALPLDKLLPGGAAPGTVIYANFCRATSGLGELLAWSPTFEGRFNVTARFGELRLE